jgi:decaprenylphospho-beta-D-ribofuranose 2-oxidase
VRSGRCCSRWVSTLHDGRLAGEYTELEGWGRRPRSGAWIRRPRTVEDVIVDASPRGVLARGLGRSYGDAALNAGGTVIDMTGVAGIRAFDPMTGAVTVAAGTSLGELIRAVLPFGWFPPVTPGTSQVTVGGAVASDIHGKNHHVDGSISRHVTSLTLLRGDGDVSVAGPEHHADVFWATAGGMGLTGVILDATIQLLPVESSLVRVRTERTGDLDDLMARLEAGDREYRYSVAWVDLLGRGASLGRGVVMGGNHATLDDLPADRRRTPLVYPRRRHVTVPDALPDGLLRVPLVRLFNEFWYRKAPRAATGLATVPGFFFPLDAVDRWNRLYGRRGFVQHQFVVPAGAEEVLRRTVERFATVRCPVHLVTMKRFGPASGGHLSFPLRGWTLAVDIPVGFGLLPRLLDEIDDRVADAGGRVYLTKDARMRRSTFTAMYPKATEWCEIRNKVDPSGRFRSDLGARLGLVD